MTKKQFDRFATLLGMQQPKPRAMNALSEISKNWFLLHPHLAALQATEGDLAKIRDIMWVELNREGGPRSHIMERLYMRYSSLRREMETNAMAALIPDQEELTE